MRKITAVILCLICLFHISGCRSFFVDEEREIYNKTIDELFAAVEDKNVEAIYNLFSPYVQNKCEDLEEKIEEFISIYSGPAQKIGDILLAGGASYDDGKSCKNAYTTFPVFTDGEYYWFYIDLMYENTVDESQIGITQLDFLTADAYYDFRSSEDKQDMNIGLNIFNKKVDDYNVISINNYPYNYRPTENLNIEEVKSFFETSTSLADFEKRFGPAAASDEFGFIYSLPEQDGESRFLYIYCQDDKIIYSDILGDFSYIETVLEEETDI